VEKRLGADPSTWDPKAIIEANDSIQYTAVGLVGAPAMPWQNRPTFQQVVEATTHR
jgi:hypothetical protein